MATERQERQEQRQEPGRWVREFSQVSGLESDRSDRSDRTSSSRMKSRGRGISGSSYAVLSLPSLPVAVLGKVMERGKVKETRATGRAAR